MSSNDRLLERLQGEFPGISFALAAPGGDGRSALIIDGRISDVCMMGQEDIRKFSAMFGDNAEIEVINGVVDLVRKDIDPDASFSTEDTESPFLSGDMIEIGEGDLIDLADLINEDDLPFPFTD